MRFLIVSEFIPKGRSSTICGSDKLKKISNQFQKLIPKTKVDDNKPLKSIEDNKHSQLDLYIYDLSPQTHNKKL